MYWAIGACCDWTLKWAGARNSSNYPRLRPPLSRLRRDPMRVLIWPECRHPPPSSWLPEKHSLATDFATATPSAPTATTHFLRELHAAGRSALQVDAARAAHGERRRAALVPHAALRRFRARSARSTGDGFLDGGDTPAFRGCSRRRAGRRGDAGRGEALMAGEAAAPSCRSPGCIMRRATHAAGFCVFNDIGVLIEQLAVAATACGASPTWTSTRTTATACSTRFEDDPDGDHRGHARGWPATCTPAPARARKPARGAAAGTKLNLPLPPGADDAAFHAAWAADRGAPGALPAASSSSSSAAPTASAATRSRILQFTRSRACARGGEPGSTGGRPGSRHACWRWAAAATTGAISRGPGPASSRRLSARDPVRGSGTIGGYLSGDPPHVQR